MLATRLFSLVLRWANFLFFRHTKKIIAARECLSRWICETADNSKAHYRGSARKEMWAQRLVRSNDIAFVIVFVRINDPAPAIRRDSTAIAPRDTSGTELVSYN